MESRTCGRNPGLSQRSCGCEHYHPRPDRVRACRSVNYLTIEGQIPHCSKQFEAIEMGERGSNEA